MQNTALKLRVAENQGEPYLVLSNEKHQFNRVDFSDDAKPEEQARKWVAEQFLKPFDIKNEILFRTGIVKLAEDRFWLFFITHHLIVDGWGYANWIRDIFAKLANDGVNEVVDADHTFLDYIDVTTQKQTEAKKERAKKHWMEHFANFPGSPFNKRLEQSDESSKLIHEMPAADFKSLVEAMSNKKLGVLPAFISALSTYFFRIYGVDGLVVGTPLHNRTAEKQRSVVGSYMSMLPVLIDNNQEQSVSSFIAATASRIKRNFRFRDYSANNIYNDLNLRQEGVDNLFSVYFNYQQIDFDFSEHGVTAETQYLSHGREAIPVKFTICEYGDQQPVQFQLDYNHAYFSKDEAVNILEATLNLVSSFVEETDSSVNSLELIDKAQLQPSPPCAPEKTRAVDVVSRFKQAVNEFPEHPAIVDGETELSYKELDHKSSQLAQVLKPYCIDSESLVALHLPRTADMPLSIMSVLKAGAAYLPVDPEYPIERKEHILNDAKPAVILTLSRLKEQIETLCSGTIICLDEISELVQDSTTMFEPQEPAANQLAYVMYTSGTTGLPKGVMVEHSQLSHFVDNITKQYELTHSDRVLQFSTFNFDISVEEIFGALSNGATLVMRDEECVSNPVYFWQFCRNNDIAVASLPTAYWHQLTNAGIDTGYPSSLRLMVIGGEAVQLPQVEKWFSQPNAPVLFNTYGPTEATVTASGYRMTSMPVVEGSIPIGKANIHTQLYVLDTEQKCVPNGTVGELYIGGACVARGYLGQIELTEEKFVRNPYSSEGDVLYRTGDLVKVLPNGDLQYIGRNDSQVKIRGFRIELGEVQSRLAQLPEIQEAIVTTHKVNDQVLLVAYVVASSLIDVPNLKAALGKSLPDYMVPAVVTQINQVPLTVNGKVNINALPAPVFEVSAETSFEAPQGEVETLLANIWQQILGKEQIDRNDNFFALGGHSLLILPMFSMLKEHGIELPTMAVFKAENLAKLALMLNIDSLSEKQEATEAVQLCDSQRMAIAERVKGGENNIEHIHALTPVQEGMFYHHQLNPTHDPYALPIILRFKNSSAFESFNTALNNVISRHEILRSAVIEGVAEVPLQVVLKEVHIKSIELSFKQEQPLEQNLDLLRSIAKQVFPLDQAPLIKLAHIVNPQDGVVYVLMQQHHMTTDRVSIGIQLKEILALMKSPTTELPAPSQYRNLVNSLLNNKEKKQQAMKIFDATLQGITESTSPFGLKDINQDISKVDSASQHLTKLQISQLKQISESYGVSEAAVFHLIWSVVVAKASFAEDVVIGSVLSGRLSAADLGVNAIGPFINVLPLRANLANSNLPEALMSIQAQLHRLIEHEQTPLAEVQQACSLPAGVPLFSSIINYRYDDTQLYNGDWGDLSVIEAQEYSNYPLEFCVDVSEAGTKIEINVDNQLCAKDIIAYIEVAVDEVSSRLITRPDTSILDFSIAPKGQFQTLLNDFNSPVVDYPGANTVHKRFEQVASANPQAVAVVCQNKQLSYAQLNSKANQLARYLIKCGVEANQIVAIHAERSELFLIAILGILKAGGAYVPLDPTNPKDRLRYMAEHCDAKVILSQKDLSAQLEVSANQQRFNLDSDWSSLSHFSEQNLENVVAPDDLAYMIYTSGSTGKPKGALVHHAGALNHIDAEFDLLGFSHSNKALKPHNFLQTAASSSDVSVWQFLAPVLSGGTTVVLPDAMDLDLYIELLQSQDVHLIQTAPSVLQLLLDKLLSLPEKSRALPALKWLMIIAEPCPVPLLNQWIETYPGIPVMNGYGPSEASDDITFHIMNQTLDSQTRSIPIGKPLPNLTMYVLDSRQQLLPVGVVGELCVSGVGVGKGYWNNPEKTAESFKVNPHQAIGGHGDMLYRTGDLGRWQPDGTLELLGRIDNQVKVRGFRIELGEIESALVGIPEVSEAAVLVHKNTDGQNCLIAYLVAHESFNNEQFEEGVRNKLADQLPDYMIPGYIQVLDSMPLNAADKIDRHALPVPDFNAVANNFVAPESELQKALADIWQNLLKVERVGNADNFFHLGGHSLTAMRLVSIVKTQLEKSLNVKTVFEYPVLGELANYIETQSVCNDIADMPIHQRESSCDIPLSFSQERLWILDQIGKGSAEYNMPIALDVDGNFDIEAAEKALNALVERHEILRTNYVVEQQVPRQLIRQKPTLKVNFQDLSNASTPEQQVKIESLINEDMMLSFDLSQDLMIRASFIKCGESKGVLLFNTHHIASDGWSEDIIIRDFVSYYEAYSNGKELSMPKLDVQYADFALWQRQRFTPSFLDEQLGYWKSQLQGIPAIHGLRTDFSRSARQSHLGAVHRFNISGLQTKNVYSLAKECGVTPFMVLHAAFSVLLAKYSNQQDIVLGTPVANRTNTQLENMVGFFVNTLVLRLDCDGENTFSTLLQQAKDVNVSAQAHQDVPFEMLVERLNPERSTSYSPLFQVMFAMETNEISELHVDGVQFTGRSQQDVATQFDLTLNAIETPDGIHFDMEYSAALFKAETIERMMSHFVHLLEQLLDTPNKTIAEHALIQEDEKRQILLDFNPEAHDYKLARTVPSRFKTQAADTPNNVAVYHNGRVLTYSELEHRVNCVAHLLLENGVNQEELIGVYMSRSPEFLTAMLAIMQIGAIYVPLDPRNPEKRVQYMIENSALKLVLTEADLANKLSVKSLVLMPDSFELVPDTEALDLIEVSPEQPAYMLYTSGSTGKPKGALLHHAGCINHIDAEFDVLGWIDNSKLQPRSILQSAAASSDISVWQFLAPILCGGHTVILDSLLDLETLFTTLQERKVDLIEVAPVMLQAIVEYAETLIRENRQLNDLSCVMTTGEATSVNLLNHVLKLYPHLKIMNGYGPSEASDDVTYFIQSEQFPSDMDEYPIGKALPNLAIYVMDDNQQLVPVGVPGEICVTGVGVGLGYWNDVEKTEKSFVANPYTGQGHAHLDDTILYRTGDLGYYDKEGRLYFSGRFDNQVKIRGFRIELGEVEAVLARQAGLKDVAVLLEQPTDKDAFLVAYFVATTGEKVDLQELRQNMLQELPEHMVPAVYMQLEAMPLNAADKIDRIALPKPDHSVATTGEFVAPHGSTESQLAQIWQELLGVPQVSRFDNFFALGGHSLLVIKLASLVSKQFDIELEVTQVFDTPALDELAAQVSKLSLQVKIQQELESTEGEEWL
ncbi:hypothetical protein PULV_a4250 [Pseudoalteromonas ulvae UL12]|nr:hypothetical protein [Pseudoalteromonas ulvae UL12]